ncbi:MAG TPA: hypothetical protein VF365_02940 [Candidatus Limnocylindria bacterium]
MLVRISLGVVAVLLALVFGGPLGVMALAPDHEAPSEVERILPDAKRYLAGQLDQPMSVVRYVGWEHRERDHLIILHFELRPFPFVIVDRAYLGSRCTPIEALDPVGMGGGRGVEDFASDPEIAYLRSDDQPPCEEGS